MYDPIDTIIGNYNIPWYKDPFWKLVFLAIIFTIILGTALRWVKEGCPPTWDEFMKRVSVERVER